MPLRTTARMTALRPGQSPPPVSTPMRILRPKYPWDGHVSRPRRGFLAVAATLLGISLLAACGSDKRPRASREAALTVYTSLPRGGLSSRRADVVAAGERLALTDAGGRAGGRRG